MIRILWWAGLFAASASLQAQVTTGSISGFVYDPAHRPVAGASVVAEDPDRGVSWSEATNAEGYYHFDDLRPASYVLTVRAAGFEQANSADLDLQVNDTLSVNFYPRIAGHRDTVAVTSEVRAVDTDSSDLGAVIERPLIEKLPLNERDFLRLALLTPGVLPPVQDSALSTRGDFAMNANGGREEFNNFLLDGVDNNDPDVNTYVLQPSVDAIEEFKIETNNYNAEYGRSAGAQVNVITRSGSNQWHGFAYDYLRNRVFDARNFFDGSQTPQLIRNQFGAGLGGPVVHDRTFFFFDYDGLRGVEGYSRLATVPTVEERNGDLTGVGTFTNPLTGQTSTSIPASQISPIAQKILNLYPLPQNGAVAGNYLAQPVGNDSLDQYNARVDHRFSDTDQLTVRYSYGNKYLLEPYTENSTTNIAGFGDYVRDRGHNAALNYTHVFGPRTVNSLILGLNRAARQILQENNHTDVNALWGVNYLPSTALEFGYPGISVSGLSGLGDQTALPIDRHTTTYQLQDTMSVSRGTHNWKFGVDLRKIELNGIVSQFPRGSLYFLGAITGSGIGDLLAGYPTFSIDATQPPAETLRTFQTDAFVQQDWRIRPNLTLNLGARYEYNTPPTDPTNRMSAFDLATGQITQVGTNGVSRSGVQSDSNNIAPRIGFAWSPGAGWSVRGGYGIFYDSSMLEVTSALYFNPPNFTVSTYFPSQFGLLTLANPFPTSNGVVPAAGLSTLDPSLRTPYVQHWNFSVERNLDWLGTVSVAYAGSKGTKLIRSLDLNQPTPGLGDLTSRRPYPEYSNIFFTGSGGNSEFDALEISINRKLRHGLTILGNYMHSKSMDDTSAFLGTFADTNFPQNSHNYHAEHALSSFDIANSAAVAFVYELPGHNVLWRHTDLRSIVTAHGGQPFTPLVSFDNSNTGNTGAPFGSDRPNVSGSTSLASPGPQEWFNTSAFSVAAPGTFGDAGRNILRGPGLFSLDLEAARRFALTEGVSLTFEAQAFNLTNRTNFDLPQLYVDQPSFGKIFSAQTPRQLQFALRLGF